MGGEGGEGESRPENIRQLEQRRLLFYSTVYCKLTQLCQLSEKLFLSISVFSISGLLSICVFLSFCMYPPLTSCFFPVSLKGTR